MLKSVRGSGEGRFFTRFIDGYEKVLRFSLRFKWLVLLVALLAFGFSFWGTVRRGLEFFPAMDAPQITISASLPEGATFEDAVAAAEEFSNRVMALSDVETVGVSVGGGGGMMGMLGMGMGLGGGGGGTSINMYVLMPDDRTLSNEALSSQIRLISEELGLDATVSGADGGMGMMAGSPVSLRIEGRELDDLRDTAIAVADLIATVDGVINVTDMAERAAPELRIRVDKDAAMAQGLTVAQVFLAVNASMSAAERTLSMTLNGRSYDIVIADGDFVAPDRAGIEGMQIATPSGMLVNLTDIAEVHEDFGFSSINRMNRNRFVNITGELEEGFNVGLVNAEIERLLADFTPLPGTSIIVGGQAEAIGDAFNDLILMLVLGMVFIYLIMVAQFQSLLSPFIIMFSIPLAFTGGFLALLVTGIHLSIVAMVGLILLTGVIINTGIVLLSRIKQMRWEGVSKKDAIIAAARERIRPVIMTELSTIFAMSVMALGIGEGAEMMQPMAIATIGGLLYATVMILLVVPVMYDLLHRNKDIRVEFVEDGEGQ